MPGDSFRAAVRRLPPVPDAVLLGRFAAARDEEAFAALVRRHGPMVLGVCRRTLRSEPDAEDAFQATFLVLARKGAALRDRAAVGSWLYGVAANVARRVRTANGRRRAAERAVPPRPAAPAGWDDGPAVIDAELARLPDKYRAAVVLCGPGGRTVREAAADLGWPPGTVATRLARGRELLARRLARRGVAVPVVLFTVAAAGRVPAALAEAAVRAGVAGGAVPAAVRAVANEVSRGMFVTKLKAAAAVVLAAGIGAAVVTAQPPAAQPPAAPPAVGKADAPAAKGEPTAARKLLDRLRELKPKNGGEALDDDSAAVLRDLIRLGPAAVPDVAAALDRTADPFLLRCLGFTARGLGDKRLVAPLIRAFPKTCLPSSSDYGLLAADPGLLAFMQAHGNDKRADGAHYSFGRPVTEFRSALQTLTGSTHGEDELRYVSLHGSAWQQAQQRALYRRCAERWAAWWEPRAKELVADARYATVGLPPAVKPARPPAVTEFPRGPGVVVGGGAANCLLESVRAAGAKAVFVDLDTGREGNLPPRLRAAPGRPERTDDIQAWAAAEGYDLMATEYTPPGAAAPHYVIRGLGLTAWRTDADRRHTLGDDIRAGRPDPGPRVEGLLARFDTATGEYAAAEPGLFLFRTRENGFGWLFVGVEVYDDTLHPGGIGQNDNELRPVAFRKGRRYAYTLVHAPEPPPAAGE